MTEFLQKEYYHAETLFALGEVQVRDLTDYALDICRDLGGSYADIRIVTIKDEDISIKLGNISVMELRREIGVGIRCVAVGQGRGWLDFQDGVGKLGFQDDVGK